MRCGGRSAPGSRDRNLPYPAPGLGDAETNDAVRQHAKPQPPPAPSGMGLGRSIRRST